MERKIGEIFEYNGEWYQCVKGISCKECDFSTNNITCDIKGRISCTRKGRSDDTSVIFKKLEKVGEPFEKNGYLYQEYEAHTYPLLMSGVAKIPTPNGFAVEIKQNKEDMEEKDIYTLDEMIDECEHRSFNTFYRQIRDWLVELKQCREKHSNSSNIGKDLKPFSLQLAKAGKPVCTRDGREARIICFDIQDKNNPIAAAVYVGECETIYLYTNKGEFQKGEENSIDLMMLPEKKEGWINIYRDSDGNNITKDDNVYSSKEAAIASAKMISGDTYVATSKTNWEE